MNGDHEILLASGRRVELRTPKLPLVRHYQVLAWPKDQGPATPREIDEMWSIAHALAREIALELFGDEECFTVLYNGARTRRMPWPHFHLIPARSPAEKRWTLMCLSLKRLLRPRRWRITTGVLAKRSADGSAPGARTEAGSVREPLIGITTGVLGA